jgi:hypothetical protein
MMMIYVLIIYAAENISELCRKAVRLDTMKSQFNLLSGWKWSAAIFFDS